MSNYLAMIIGGLSLGGLILLGKGCLQIYYKLSDFMERLSDERERKKLQKLLEKAAFIVYGKSLKETYRRGKLSINNLALILEEVKQIDPMIYEELIVKLSVSIRKEEVRQGLAKASELVELPNFFGDDADDDLIDYDKD